MPKIGLAKPSDEDFEEEEFEDIEEQEEEEETPPAKKKAKPAPVVDAEEEEEEEEEAPRRRGRPKGAVAKKSPAKKKRASKSTALATTVNEEGFEGDWDATDEELPRISLIQPNNELLEDENMRAALGQYLYDDEFILGTSMQVLILKIIKTFSEITEDGSIGETWYSRADAEESGRDYKPGARLLLAVIVPADSEDAEAAAYADEEHAYILATMFLQGRSYRAVQSMRKVLRRTGEKLKDVVWNFTAVIKPVNKTKWRVTTCKKAGNVSETTLETLGDVIDSI